MYCTSPDNGTASRLSAPGVASEPAPGFPTSSQFTRIAVVLLCYFGLRLLFLATRISPFIPPDETTHFGISRLFSRALLLPVNSPESFQYGLVTNIPWLYYWVTGKLLWLNFLGISDLVFLRLLNIPLAFGLVYYAWRTLRLLTEDRLSQLLLLVAMTNTMMLTFLSSFVSYDNLANLLAAMSVYYLLAFFKERSATLLTASLVCQLAGCLTKITFLPLVLVLTVLAVVHELKNLPWLFAALAAGARRPGGALLTLALLLGLTLNLQLYAGNYAKYRALAPEATDVLPLESALQNRIVARNYVLDQFKKGRVTKAQALEMTAQIKHEGDRGDAVFMIEKYAKFKNHELLFMGPGSYAPQWVARMAAGIFGIFGHQALPAEGLLVAPFALLAALSLAGMLLRWRPGDAEGLAGYLLVIALFYTLFLMYEVNYREYLDTGARYLAVQGRYLFPIIAPVYVLFSFYWMRLFAGRTPRLAVWGLAVAIFLLCDFPLFLARITPDWVTWPTN